ncbi:MAG TPA: FKBP-type peptidyl-prolyl cis-trans isomerase [Mucilaginibacter sp.]|jgi:FKBP-type peptidyl-prolyl cis-trans isomerase|nr:FKBP-type peptidyl-prolyl cis-trans isomerase [Mucilaginibacter sp.]
MKSILFTLVLLLTIGLTACRKDKNYPDIKAYDQQQIASYIAANGITDMVKDTSGKDSTGIWYKIITPGTGAAVDYPTEISYVYTIKSFDGKFSATDTVLNHFDGLLGHTAPNGLILAIRNILKNKGGKMRVLIPSHLGYGINGTGSGSNSVANARIAGNQCLDYTINLVDKQYVYDDLVIQKYMAANNLSGYTKITTGIDSGMYYKITTVGTGNAISNISSLTINYVGKLMNNTVFDDHSTTTATFADMDNTIAAKGFEYGLELAKGGGGISLIFPSSLGYGPGGSPGIIPSNACLRFDITNIVVNP